MSKDLPLFNFTESPKAENEKSEPLVKDTRVDLQIVNGKKETSKDQHLKDLAARVAKLMKQGENYLSACNMVFNTERISKNERKEYRSAIGEILGKRGAQKTKKIKTYKKRHSVAKGKVFTPYQSDQMISGSKEWQAEEEKRAGQTYQDSDFE